MSKNVVQFRSQRQREKEVDLLAKYREIGIAAIAAANQSTQKKSSMIEKRVASAHHD